MTRRQLRISLQRKEERTSYCFTTAKYVGMVFLDYLLRDTHLIWLHYIYTVYHWRKLNTCRYEKWWIMVCSKKVDNVTWMLILFFLITIFTSLGLRRGSGGNPIPTDPLMWEPFCHPCWFVVNRVRHFMLNFRNKIISYIVLSFLFHAVEYHHFEKW